MTRKVLFFDFLFGMFVIFNLHALGSETDKDFLSFTAKSEGAFVNLRKIGSPHEIHLRYSFDKEKWAEYKFDTIYLNNNQTVYFSAREDGNALFSKNIYTNYYNFSFQGEIRGGGNIMSLLDSTCTRLDVPSNCFANLFECNPLHPNLYSSPSLPATRLGDSCYYRMFSNCKITDAPVLPATEVKTMCYTEMFSLCELLISAPTLPALTLAPACYKGMFSYCSALEEAPTLPATSLAPECYREMFDSASSLINAPSLPALHLEAHCYRAMFYNCIHLMDAPVLPATELADSCYFSMFTYCSSLRKAPDLPATELQNGCYTNMFRNCTNLSFIKVYFPQWSYKDIIDEPLDSWLENVSKNGVFIATSPSLTNENIPTGWTFKIVPPLVLKDSVDPTNLLNEVISQQKKDTNYLPDIHLHRSFVFNGNFNTLCLPFSINLSEQITIHPQLAQLLSDMTVERFVKDSIIGDTLFLITQTIQSEIESGVPYFIKWNTPLNNMDSVVIKNVNISTFLKFRQGTHCSIEGTFSPKTLTNNAQNQYFYLEDGENEFKAVHDNYTSKGFRAYVKIPANLNPIASVKICHINELPSADDTHSSIQRNVSEDAKNDVRKEISNGQVFIRKDGCRYTVDGLLFSCPASNEK